MTHHVRGQSIDSNSSEDQTLSIACRRMSPAISGLTAAYDTQESVSQTPPLSPRVVENSSCQYVFPSAPDRSLKHGALLHKPDGGALCAGFEVVVVFARLVSQMATFIADPKPTTCFDAVAAPSLSVHAYFMRIAEYFQCSHECFVLSSIYLHRILKRNPEFRITALNVHRLFLSSIVLAAKYHDDVYYANEYYARVGGITGRELNSLELQFVKLVGWQLAVSANEYAECHMHMMASGARMSHGVDQSFTSSPSTTCFNLVWNVIWDYGGSAHMHVCQGSLPSSPDEIGPGAPCKYSENLLVEPALVTKVERPRDSMATDWPVKSPNLFSRALATRMLARESRLLKLSVERPTIRYFRGRPTRLHSSAGKLRRSDVREHGIRHGQRRLVIR